MQTFSSLADFASNHDVDLSEACGRARWRMGDRSGAWFYKRLVAVPSVTRWPTPWSELLAPDLLDRVGLPTAPVSLIQIEEGTQWILRLRAVGAAARRAAIHDQTTLLGAGFWQLFLFDLLVGNGDRTLANVLVLESPLRYVPIDHELALLTPGAIRSCCPYFHFVPPGKVPAPSRRNAYERALDNERGTPVAIARANPIYRRLLTPGDQLRALMQAWAAGARVALTADWVDDRLADLPDALFPGGAAEGKRYLRETLQARLKWLPDAIADL